MRFGLITTGGLGRLIRPHPASSTNPKLTQPLRSSNVYSCSAQLKALDIFGAALAEGCHAHIVRFHVRFPVRFVIDTSDFGFIQNGSNKSLSNRPSSVYMKPTPRALL